MTIAPQAAMRPGLSGFLFFCSVPAVSAVVTRDRTGASTDVVAMIALSPQARSDSPALSTRSWMSATAAKMTNKITDSALA